MNKSFLYLLYQYTGVVYRFVLRFFHHTITWYKMKCLCGEFHNFYTSGIPFIEVSRKKNGNIKIGKNFSMNNGMSNNQIGFGNTPCVLSVTNGNIIIEDNVGISQTALIAYNANIFIGNYTIIGGGVKIYTTDFHPVNYLQRRNYESNILNMLCKDVNIGHDCFIGAGSIVLKGVTIGNNTIIGAGSIVTQSIPSNCIAAGNPCKVIRHLVVE